MITLKKLLLVLLLVTAAGQTRAQAIDSFHINTLVNPHELFVRLHFPDSSYYVERTFDRVALIYPPVNIVTFFYRSCESIKANPVRDTIIPIYTPEPYRLMLWLVRDSNTVVPDCKFAEEIQNVDSALYDSQFTGIANPSISNDALHIYPNPATDVLYVAGAQGCELQLFDGLGRLLLQQKLQNEQEAMNVSALAPGLYYIHCYRDRQLLKSHCFSKLP